MGLACRVVLIGMMGSGKTTVGRLLAERTGWPLRDNDDLIRELFDATPREILAAGDETALLAAEVEALKAGLACAEPCIVAAAGGIIVDTPARAAVVSAGLIVWFSASVATIHRRAASGEHRPWPDPDRLAWIEQAVAQRNRLYASVADVTLDADDASPSFLADAILARLRQSEACRPFLT
jgi:shikimate kinase